MVEGVLGVFVHDGPLSVESEDLECGSKGVEEDGKEQEGTA